MRKKILYVHMYDAAQFLSGFLVSEIKYAIGIRCCFSHSQ